MKFDTLAFYYFKDSVRGLGTGVMHLGTKHRIKTHAEWEEIRVFVRDNFSEHEMLDGKENFFLYDIKQCRKTKGVLGWVDEHSDIVTGKQIGRAHV